MNKTTKIIIAIIISTGITGAVFAACPIDSTMCVSDLMDINTTPTFQTDSIMNNTHTNFPSTTNSNTSPQIRNEVKSDYNTIQNNTGTYDATCQFGTCLPSSKNSSFPNMR